MQCVILAGGLGTRMRGIADDVPKTLLPVAGKPFAHHQLSWLSREGVEKVIYALGHGADAVRGYVGNGGKWGIDVAYVDEGDRLRGTGGALRLAADGGHLDDAFFVLYGDSYLQIGLAALWSASGRGAEPTMTVYRNAGRWDASNAVVANGHVSLFVKGRADAAEIGMAYIDYGISVLTRKCVFDFIPPDDPYDLAEAYHRLSVTGTLRAHEVHERFYEVGSPDGLAELEAHLSAVDGGAEP